MSSAQGQNAGATLNPLKRPGPTVYPILILLASLLVACAPAARYPAGQALLQGGDPRFPEPPLSLRADLEFTSRKGGRKTTVSATLSARPYQAYKLDIHGLPGMVEASFLWTDTGWTAVLFGREEYLEGHGDSVDLFALGLGPVPVHALFGFLWGDFFPGTGARPPVPGDSVASLLGPSDFRPAGDRMEYRAGGQKWWARVDPGTGLVSEAFREDSTFRVSYGYYASYSPPAGPGGKGRPRPVPSAVKAFSGREELLEVRVESVEDNPAWKRNPFRIRVPAGFRRLQGFPGR